MSSARRGGLSGMTHLRCLADAGLVAARGARPEPPSRRADTRAAGRISIMGRMTAPDHHETTARAAAATTPARTNGARG